MKKFKIKNVLAVCALAVVIAVGGVIAFNSKNPNAGYDFSDQTRAVFGQSYYGSAAGVADNYTDTYVVARFRSMKATFYAYTEGVSDGWLDNSPDGDEVVFYPGSELVLLKVTGKGGSVETTETTLLFSATGVYRDPDVSMDGKTLVYSYKDSELNDDYHLYKLDLESFRPGVDTPEQITFGQGVADIEPKWLPNGRIVFNSTRAVQRVDCWKTAVSNLYLCEADGSNIIRIGYDQVHTTYPTVAADGRVIYTRWDYNDRTQLYVHAIFQMLPDGRNQTEVYGNNSSWPTSEMHTRQIPGTNSKYVSITAGHHTPQMGKLAVIDVARGRNSKEAVQYLFETDYTTGEYVDEAGQSGRVYAYPYPINENEFLVARADRREDANTQMNIYYANSETGEFTVLAKPKNITAKDKNGAEYTVSVGAQQIVPVMAREVLDRPIGTDYSEDKGIVYFSDIYDGEGMKGVTRGEAKWVRVVALDYRAYSLGTNASVGTGTSDPFSPAGAANTSWDIKQVLGVVPIESDGSCLFYIPSDVPVYFQILNEEGLLIQSMRSWTTLMPNETFSCIGCHEDKNSTPPIGGSVTLAMRKGTQKIQKDLWMHNDSAYDNYDPYTDFKGFSYLQEIQPILDDSCVACHNDKGTASSLIGMSVEDDGETESIEEEVILPWEYSYKYNMRTSAHTDANWYKESFNDVSWSTGGAPFGDTGDGVSKTNWPSSTKYIYLRTTFNVTAAQAASLAEKNLVLTWQYDENPAVYINGVLAKTATSYITGQAKVILNSALLKEGTNLIAVSAYDTEGGRYIGVGLGIREKNAFEQNLVENTVLPLSSDGWAYRTTEVSTAPAVVNYEKISFVPDASWTTGARMPLGGQLATNSGGTAWTSSSKYIYLRKNFALSADELNSFKQGDKSYFLLLDYQDGIEVYLNEVLIFSASGGSSGLKYVNFTTEALKLLKADNVIAVRTVSVKESNFINAGIAWCETSNIPLASFENTRVLGKREKMFYTLSYLVLTGSTIQDAGGNYFFRANAENSYTNFISSMSQVSMLDPYQTGSTKSNLITKLLSESHAWLFEGNESLGIAPITLEQIQKIACWIDLAVPLRGAYDESANWGYDEYRIAEEYQNQREYYNAVDKLNKKAVAGLADTREINVTYESRGIVVSDITKGGLIQMYPGQSAVKGDNKSFQEGDIIRVTLPAGVEYFWFSLNPRLKLTLIHAPDGEFIYQFSAASVYSAIFPPTVMRYLDPTVTVFLPTEAELSAEYNLALNPYQVNPGGTYGAQASSNNVHENMVQFAASNAIDGFRNNVGHDTYPRQSWGPTNSISPTDYFMIDFGREVTVNKFIIHIRADFPHDTYFDTFDIIFSDNTTVKATLTKTREMQLITLSEPITTTSVKFINFHVVDNPDGGSNWASLRQVEVYGTNG